jgi:hypothetical protein
MERLTNAEEEAYSNLAVLNKINATKQLKNIKDPDVLRNE